MDKFTVHSGIAAALIRNNIDTDTIIPSREMKTVSKLGLAPGLFAPWRYTNEKTKTPDPGFILNVSPFDRASILLSSNNFGCGSSREHAVWALKEFGIKCVIAQSFGSIFYRNCIANGVLPISLESENVESLAKKGGAKVTVDLVNNTVTCDNLKYEFLLNEGDRKKLIDGTDPIDSTLKYSKEIDEFSMRDKMQRPWI